MGERCEFCDREGCSGRAAQAWSPEARAASERVLGMRANRVSEADRALIDEAARLANEAWADCKAHRVDWRARAIAAESALATARRVAGKALAKCEHEPGCGFVRAQHAHSKGYRGSDAEPDECTCYIASLRAELEKP